MDRHEAPRRSRIRVAAAFCNFLSRPRTVEQMASKAETDSALTVARPCQGIALTGHFLPPRPALFLFLSSTWGRADQQTSRDSSHVRGVLFCTPLFPSLLQSRSWLSSAANQV